MNCLKFKMLRIDIYKSNNIIRVNMDTKLMGNQYKITTKLVK